MEVYQFVCKTDVKMWTKMTTCARQSTLHGLDWISNALLNPSKTLQLPVPCWISAFAKTTTLAGPRHSSGSRQTSADPFNSVNRIPRCLHYGNELFQGAQPVCVPKHFTNYTKTAIKCNLPFNAHHLRLAADRDQWRHTCHAAYTFLVGAAADRCRRRYGPWPSSTTSGPQCSSLRIRLRA